MPVNVTSGNSAEFVAQFFDSTGAATTPSSATLTITYTAAAGSTASTSLGMTLSGTTFTATWATSVAAIGAVNWSVNAPGQTAATTGSLRLISGN
jgi:hypothetical protein